MRLLQSPFRVLLVKCDRQKCLLVFFKCWAYSNPIPSHIYHMSLLISWSKHCRYPQLWHHIQPLPFWFSCAGPCNDEVKQIEEERKLHLKFMVSSTSINLYDPKGSDRILMRLRPAICDEISWFMDGLVVKGGVWYSFEYLNWLCLGFCGNLCWRCQYFSDDIMIWMSCSLYGSKCHYTYDSLEVSEVQSLHFSIRSSIHHWKVGQMTEVATATIVQNLVLSYEVVDLISSLHKD